MARKRRVSTREGGRRTKALAPKADALSEPGLETLEVAYDAWLAKRLERDAARSRYAEERARLDDQATFVVGAVKAASGELPLSPGNDALARRGESLDSFASEAQARLAAARAELDARAEQSERAYAQELEDVRERLTEKVRRCLSRVRPRFRVVVRRAGAERRILHVERLAPDDAVLALFALTERIPTRYGFLFDDSTDDAQKPPPPLYPDERNDDVRPSPSALRSLVAARGGALPVKGFLPLFVPRPGGGEDFVRLLQRGPVMEAELQDADAFRNVLSLDEAERLGGHLLRLKVEGRIELELGLG
jgi:hypothetical protein